MTFPSHTFCSVSFSPSGSCGARVPPPTVAQAVSTRISSQQSAAMKRRSVSAPPLHDERLTLLCVQPFHELRNDGTVKVHSFEGGTVAVEDDSARRRTRPMAHVQSWLVAFGGHSAHQYGVSLCAKLMYEHSRIGRGDGKRTEVVVHISVCGLCPFESDERAALLVEGDEAAVQPSAFLLQHAHRHFYAGVTQLLYAASVHLGEGSTHPTTQRFTPFLTIRSAQGGVLP